MTKQTIAIAGTALLATLAGDTGRRHLGRACAGHGCAHAGAADLCRHTDEPGRQGVGNGSRCNAKAVRCGERGVEGAGRRDSEQG